MVGIGVIVSLLKCLLGLCISLIELVDIYYY